MPSSRVVGVDVTAHKEERNAADPRKKPKLRARYYVELVVGSPRQRHVRLGFAGSFKALLGLHRAFVRAYLDRLGPEPPPSTGVRSSLSSSTSSGTSRTSLSSTSSPRGIKKFVHDFRLKKHIPTEPHAVNHVHRGGNQSDDIALPFLPAFPAANTLLVQLESGSGDAKDDKKLSARVSALFEYYTQLFNSDEGELFLELVQERSIEQAEKNAAINSSDGVAGLQDAAPSSRGGLFRFLARHSSAKSAAGSDLSKALEFFAPIQVSSSGKARPLKRVKPRSELAGPRLG
ncbi:hypothetical protein PybrP1_005186 [[Pythium] brassicae (nom. inval.)]|nr:hypothetical protein PybrP1_005186 [[Pythium] brassicae (nom. inval.)]